MGVCDASVRWKYGRPIDISIQRLNGRLHWGRPCSSSGGKERCRTVAAAAVWQRLRTELLRIVQSVAEALESIVQLSQSPLTFYSWRDQ